MTFEEMVDALEEARKNGLGLSAVREQSLEILEMGFPTERAYGPSGPVTAMFVSGRRIETPDARLTPELIAAMRQWFDGQERLLGGVQPVWQAHDRYVE